MGVTNKLYLLSKYRIERADLGKIQIGIDSIARGLHRKIVKKIGVKDLLNSWTLEELKNLFKIEFEENDWFVGDEEYFFSEENGDKIEVGEFAKEELAFSAYCPNCKFNLYDKVLRIAIEKFKKKPDGNQTRLKLIENQEGIQCPSCGVIAESNELTGRKIIGNFRIELPHLLLEHFTWKEIIGYFNSDKEHNFYIEHYQYP